MIDQKMELSNEDNLRLNILMHQDVKAIRISESQMLLEALLGDKEVAIKLNANCNKDRYIKQVKEFLSSSFLGSPAGFPVFLKRWTRMGETQHDNISELLKLGEPEAIVAITYCKTISEEHACYAWWAYPSVEIARQLLTHDNIAKIDLANELASFLMEFLPFETETSDIILTVKLLLQRELLSAENKNSLWLKGKRKSAYLVGFLLAETKYLPPLMDAHPAYTKETHNPSDIPDIESIHYLSASGQSYIQACLQALERYSDQDSIVYLFDAISQFFCTHSELISNASPQAHKEALDFLSSVNQSHLIPVLARSNAIGSVLRRKLLPVTDPVKYHLQQLLS